MKLKIFSVHASRTDFLELQYKSLSYFLEDDFEYYCIDNFVDSASTEFVFNKCKDLNINYVRFNSYELKGNAFDHAPALNSIKTITTDDCINVVLDFDIFLINKFSIIRYIENFDIAGMYQQRNNFELEYLAPFIVIVNCGKNFTEIDFDSRKDILSDVGGNISHYLKNRKVKLIRHTSALNRKNDVDCFNIDYNPSFGCQILESSFLHYYRGTNWDNSSNIYHKEKTEWLNNALDYSKNKNILNQSYLDKYQNVFNHSFNYWNGSEQPFNSVMNPYLVQ